LSTNTKKVFDGYNSQVPIILESNKENNINTNDIKNIVNQPNNKYNVININLHNNNPPSNISNNILNLLGNKNKDN
jgi:hypothetical protein